MFAHRNLSCTRIIINIIITLLYSPLPELYIIVTSVLHSFLPDSISCTVEEPSYLYIYIIYVCVYIDYIIYKQLAIYNFLYIYNQLLQYKYNVIYGNYIQLHIYIQLYVQYTNSFIILTCTHVYSLFSYSYIIKLQLYIIFIIFYSNS